MNNNKELKQKKVFRGIVKVLGSFLYKRSYSQKADQTRREDYADPKSKDGDSREMEESRTTSSISDD